MNKKERIAEQGYSMAWWAVILATVVVPLMSLTVDITRAGAVKTWLSAATDAACNAQAQLSAEHLMYRSLTETKPLNLPTKPPHGARATVAINVVRNMTAVVGPVSSQPVMVECQGQASLTAVTPLLGTMNITARARAESRWYGGPAAP